MVIYTQRDCRFCAGAKALLERRGVAFEEIDVTDEEQERARLIQLSGALTLPQVFVEETLLGGFDRLMALDRAGGLIAQIDAAAAS